MEQESRWQRRRQLKSTLFLCSSLLLLSVFFCFHFLSRRQPGPRWTRLAAAEAELVADIDCSGHGRAFVDGVLDGGGLPVCECNTCYGGSDCSQMMPDCPANAQSGDPLFLEPYWKRHAASSAVVFSGWHRMSYNANGADYMSLELKKRIRLLHKALGNAVTDGRFILFGCGSMQLLNSLVHALSPPGGGGNSSSKASPARVVASVPYYQSYRTQTNLFDGKAYTWAGETSEWSNATAHSPSSFIEFVTSPNNPDGLLKSPVLSGSSVIYDHAYYLPHYTAIPAPADGDVMTFTISKTSGHAGSRFGWALIKDENVYRRAAEYLIRNTIGVSRDTQLRVLKIMDVIIGQIGGEDDIFRFGHEKLRERWSKLRNVVSSSSGRFSLQDISPRYCTYFKKIRDPSPAYAWLKCEWEEDEDCAALLLEGGIMTRAGTMYGADSRHTRLSLVKTDDDFNMLLRRMKALVAKEPVAAASI